MKNIFFFLLPKSEVVYLKPNATIRQALEKMEHHRYSAIPLIDDEGKYVGILTEGDLLWTIKNTPELDFQNSNKFLIQMIEKRFSYEPVSVNADTKELLTLSVRQNFVPVVDDTGVFIGIVKRQEVINYCYKALFEQGVIV
ncbi:MAG: CBS domain-containing protein [Clostridia bacterium]